MPRSLIPSPNEEAYIMEQAIQKQKRERLVAARKQSLVWCRHKTNNQQIKNKQKQISDQLEATKTKLSELNEKEAEIKKELENAMSSVGEAYFDAKKENSEERDAKKAKMLLDFRVAAAKRHRAALRQLNKAKEQQRAEQLKIIERKKEIRIHENTRSKELLERPLQNSQPLIEVPELEACSKRALRGLDAFTKTYYHLPISGVGVVDEKSLDAKDTKDAKTLASEVEKMMADCRAQLQQSKQAREERADVRGNAALQKVQLKNVLEDVTSKLDKYAVYNRTRKQPSMVRTNVFASNLAREITQKQHQMDLEHAVEDIFDRHNEVVEMVLPSSVKFENVHSSLDTVMERSEVEPLQETTQPSPIPEVCVSEPSSSPDDKIETDSDEYLANESRPSLNLYFPVHSDISSEPSPARDEHDSDIAAVNEADESEQMGEEAMNNETIEVSTDVSRETVDETQDLEPVTPLPGIRKKLSTVDLTSSSSSSAPSVSNSSISTLKSVPVTATAQEIKGSEINNKHALDLSSLIKDQLKINNELRAMGRPLNTSVEVEELSPKQPPPIVYTKDISSSRHSSTPSEGKSSTSFEEIIQELLSSSQVSSNRSAEVSKASDSMSQHTLSTDNSLVSQTLIPHLADQRSVVSGSLAQSQLSSRDVSSASSGGSGKSGKLKSASASSGLSELQKQLARINSHLSEIEKIKDKDNLFYQV
ncbi:hypothetical protein ACHWQZ_G004605 [Mnemiopsis leidyi]